ncbi:hypothetical protein [Actinomyces oricola]|uniref:hypothetical protein n=1 Tax=Actinomyces oricola TaxID=206043 RepID=UPI000FFF5509|nr:hypothetical protein [Actinomyces oricola]
MRDSAARASGRRWRQWVIGGALGGGLLALLTARSFDASGVATVLDTALGAGGLGLAAGAVALHRERRSRPELEGTAWADYEAALASLRGQVARSSGVLPAAQGLRWQEVLDDLTTVGLMWEAPGTDEQMRCDAMALVRVYAPRVLLGQVEAARGDLGEGEGPTHPQHKVVARAAAELRSCAQAARRRALDADGAALEARFSHLTALEELRVLQTRLELPDGSSEAGGATGPQGQRNPA